MVYMALITTFEGRHWFDMGKCSSYEKARLKAEKKALYELKGAETQVKEVMLKKDWIKYFRYERGKLVDIRNELQRM